MFTIDLYTVLRKFSHLKRRKIYSFVAEYTCRETFTDLDTNLSFESYLINNYPSLNDAVHSFRRLKIRAEIDLVVNNFPNLDYSLPPLLQPFTLDDAKNGVGMFNQLLQKSISPPSFDFLIRLFRLSEFVNNPYLRQRQIDLSSFNQNDDQPMKMSSRYIPLLPKDLCHIPLRPVDDDLLANVNKRSRSKGRFPFHLPSFLNKRRFFSTKSSTIQTPSSRNGTGKYFHR